MRLHEMASLLNALFDGAQIRGVHRLVPTCIHVLRYFFGSDLVDVLLPYSSCVCSSSEATAQRVMLRLLGFLAIQVRVCVCVCVF